MDTSAVPETSLPNLRRWNIGLTVLHAAQAVVIALLASGFAITVTSQYPMGPPGTPASSPKALFDVQIAPAIVVFLALAALDHLLTATVFRARYETELRAGLNRFRWIEYSVSATIMLLLICFYNGILGITDVVLIIGANVSMIFFGWLMELMNPPSRTTTIWLPFWFGCVAGAAPWVAIIINLFGAGIGNVPGFVFGIFLSLFIFFMSFALNQWLQYRRVGKWAEYGFGEKVYLVLSLVAKSALAWQIFAGSLAS